MPAATIPAMAPLPRPGRVCTLACALAGGVPQTRVLVADPSEIVAPILQVGCTKQPGSRCSAVVLYLPGWHGLQAILA